MIGIARNFTVIALAATLAGCAGSLRGVEPILNADGPTSGHATNGDKKSARDRFAAAANTAAETPTPATLAEMMDSGFALADAHCRSFFQDMRILERDAAISRDMVAPIIVTLTGIVALKGFSAATSDEYLTILTLGSNAALAGIDAVDKHFLFGADNINDVEVLTVKALAESERKIREQGTATYGIATRQLSGHQIVCTPASILDLAQKAIRAGEVVANTRSVDASDREVLVALASELGLPGALTQEQAGAIWYLYRSGTLPAQLPGAIVTELLALGTDPLIAKDANGVVTTTSAGQSKAVKLMLVLDRFSGSTRQNFEATTRALNDVRLGRAAPAVAPAFMIAPAGQASTIVLDVR